MPATSNLASLARLPAAEPGEVGLSAERLQRLAGTFSGLVDQARIAGAVIAVMRRGRLAWAAAVGRRDPDQDAPMTVDSLFRLYSMTKPFTSVAAMMLAEEGRLLLSDPVSAWLPGFAQQQVQAGKPAGGEPMPLEPARRPSTVHDLLRHTAGLVNESLYESTPVKTLYRRAGIPSTDQTLQEWVDKIAALPLAFQPGTVFDYSHATNVLGRVVELASGLPLDRFFAERITGPLGLRDTAFHVPEAEWHRLAEAAPDPATKRRPKLREVKSPPRMLSGGAGLVSSAGDYLRFAAMLLNGGELDGARLLSRKTVAFMTGDHLGPGMRRDTTSAQQLLGPGYGFGLGFAVRTAAGESVLPGSVGDFYWGGMAGTQFWVDPQEQLAAVLMLQQPGEFTPAWHLLRQGVYAALED